MTSDGNNFNDFPENQLTKFRAVQTVLRQNVVHINGLREGASRKNLPGNYACGENVTVAVQGIKKT